MNHNNEVEGKPPKQQETPPQDGQTQDRDSGLFEQLDGLEGAGNMFSEGEDEEGVSPETQHAAAPAQENIQDEVVVEVVEATQSDDPSDEETIDLDLVAAAVAEVVSQNVASTETPQPVETSPDDGDIIVVEEGDDAGQVIEVVSSEADLARIQDLEGEIDVLRQHQMKLQEQIQSLIEEQEATSRDRDEHKNRLLRMAADLENVRKRKEREKDELRKYGADRVVLEMLPAVDNLERALEHAQKTEDDSSIADGVKMVLRQLLSGLEKHGIKGFTSVLERFDPQRHEAIQQIETSEHETGVVLQEFQKGYFLHDRLLRPALVVVSKYVAPPEPEEDDDAPELIEVSGEEEESAPILEEISPADASPDASEEQPAQESNETPEA